MSRFVRVTFAIHLLVAAAAFAHNPTITAVAVCKDGTAVINYTSTSWSPYALEGENSNIAIYVNTVQVARGAYVFPENSFSGSTPAPNAESVTVTAYAAADWENGVAGGQLESVIVKIPDGCSAGMGEGRFTGGGHQIRVGAARVTRGLTVHCDLLLSNNLQVNWGGNSFHMTEHLTTVACTDDPDITQAPPEAPLDTLIGIGDGRYNNANGYTIEFTLVDQGEPGRNDMASFLIYETADPTNVVLDVPLGFITGGNLQAHFDQPHN